MSAFLDGELTRAAFCWRIERQDGVCLGFTSHDRDLEVDGLSYCAAPGMLPSTISLSDGFDADAMEIGGALTSRSITSEDLAAGRWDGADLRLFMVDWSSPEGERRELARGTLGAVSLSGGGFSAELKGPAAMLERPAAEQTSPECRAQLSDGRCRVDMAGRVRITRIAAVHAEDVIEVVEAAAGAAYAYGRLRWINGANSGMESVVHASAGNRLTLREPPHRPPLPGDLVEIREGCDKSFATCRARFGNAANFRGEPHLPGMDLLTRFPGA